MAETTLTIRQIINLGYEIFDFDYPMFKTEYKEVFEKLFIDYYLFEDIAFETPGQFKHFLKNKLNLVMPHYNKLYETQEIEQRILDNYDVKEQYTREITGDSKGVSKNNSRNMFKDTPKTKIDITNFDTVTNLTKVLSDSENESVNNAIEKYTRTMQGNIGVQTDSDAIIKYWQSLRNITLEIFENELTSLFMGVF